MTVEELVSGVAIHPCAAKEKGHDDEGFNESPRSHDGWEEKIKVK